MFRSPSFLLDRNRLSSFLQLHQPIGFGDDVANERLRSIARLSGCGDGKVLRAKDFDLDTTKAEPNERKLEAFEEPRSSSQDEDVFLKQRIYMIRSETAALRTLVKELIGRVRSKRYFNAVRLVLDTPAPTEQTAEAAESDNDHAILSCCGHSGTVGTIRAAAHGKCFEPSCGAQVQPHNIIRGAALGTDRPSGHYGYKLETLITLIDATPDEERVLVFVQFQDLFDKVHEALTVYGVPTIVLEAGKSADQLKAFQDEKKTGVKVLLLLATDSSSSGTSSVRVSP
jgi:SNF2 family DNA or RNA helicase